MDAVERCMALLTSAVELNAKRGGKKPEELFEVEYLEDEDVAAIRQILAERAALIAAWPDSGTAARTIHSLNGGRWNIAHMGGVYPTRESAVLTAAGIEREGEE
jgi:hypothetical protein